MAYPFLIFISLGKIPLNIIILTLLGLFILRFALSRNKLNRHPYLIRLGLLSALAGILICLFSFFKQESLLYYPVLMNLTFLIVFGLSLKYPPSIIELFARMVEKDFPDKAVAYTKKVTLAWCIFFIFNGGVAFYTAWLKDMSIWTLYNGLISYLLMGLFFIVEFGVRQYVKRNQ